MAKAESTARAQKPKAPPPKGQAKKAAPEATPAERPRPKGTGEIPARLKVRFQQSVLPALMKERGYTNPWQVPRLHKIVVSMGVG